MTTIRNREKTIFYIVTTTALILCLLVGICIGLSCIDYIVAKQPQDLHLLTPALRILLACIMGIPIGTALFQIFDWLRNWGN